MRVKQIPLDADTDGMWARYFGRTDLDLGGDALFAFLLGLGVLVVTKNTGLLDGASSDTAVLVVRFAAGAMLLATFVGGVAIGRSVSAVLSR